MNYFPISLKVKDRPVTVIGGGTVAQQRVEALLDCEARVRVIAPEVTQTLRALANSEAIRIEPRTYRSGDLAGAWAVLAATDDPNVNQAAWREAQQLGIPISLADDPEKCDFIMPAIVRRGGLTVAISTGGASPALAARLKRRLGAMIGPEYSRLLEVLSRTRDRLRNSVSDVKERRRLNYRIVDSNILSWILESDERTLDERIEAIIADPSSVSPQAEGIVYIVGAGPGDPGLITTRGLDCIRVADVILHDRLINPALLGDARPGAEVINVGKRVGDRNSMQDLIHTLMVERARSGQVVCRLKGGDPFVFGRGGEEAQALTEADVPFEIIPGVTSAIAVPAAARIPVTHRDCAHSFMVMTGSRADDASPEEWAGAVSVIAGGGTLVILMGLSRIGTILDRLRSAGCAPSTPAAIISRGTWIEQDVRVGTLQNIEVEGEGVVSPAVIVFGVTVRERVRLQEVRAAIGRRVDPT